MSSSLFVKKKRKKRSGSSFFEVFCAFYRKKFVDKKGLVCMIKPKKGRATNKHLLVESTELSISKSP